MACFVVEQRVHTVLVRCHLLVRVRWHVDGVVQGWADDEGPGVIPDCAVCTHNPLTVGGFPSPCVIVEVENAKRVVVVGDGAGVGEEGAGVPF